MSKPIGPGVIGMVDRHVDDAVRWGCGLHGVVTAFFVGDDYAELRAATEQLQQAAMRVQQIWKALPVAEQVKER